MSQYTSQTLEHLGLVSAMADELRIAETIDRLIEQDGSQRHVSIGVCIKAMILNGLGFANRQLYLLPQFFDLILLNLFEKLYQNFLFFLYSFLQYYVVLD